MAKRRSKIVYAPRSRRRSSGTDRSQSASSYEQDTKETTRRNKRPDANNESASSNLENTQRKSKSKKSSGSSSDRASSPHKPSTSNQAEGGFEVVSKTSKHKGVVKKRTYQKRNKTVKADEAAPERIRDMTVTKKAYAKWKPLSSSTKKYTKQVLESTILSVLNSVGKESKKSDLQVHLKQLSDRIIKRLDKVKGPAQKGDYSKMEAESHKLEDAVISCNRQIEALEKELEEQTRLFEQDEQMLESFSNQGQELQQLHPLLQKQPANALNLPSLSSADIHKISSVCEIPTSLETSGERLAQSLARLSDQAQQSGFINWLESLSDKNNS